MVSCDAIHPDGGGQVIAVSSPASIDDFWPLSGISIGFPRLSGQLDRAAHASALAPLAPGASVTPEIRAMATVMRSTFPPGDWHTVGICFCSSVSHSPSREGFAMGSDRLFRALDFMQPSDDEPIRSVIMETAEAVVVAWHVKPGQRIAAHVHPSGQDTWTILSGQGTYQTEASGSSLAITAGDVVVAPMGCVHGVSNHGQEPLTFISVVSPADAGFEPIHDEFISIAPLSA